MFAVVYPDPQTAEQAMDRIDWADFDQQIYVIDACWMSAGQDGVEIHPRGHPVGSSAARWGTTGLMIGLLFALPVVGLATGAAIGVHRGKHQQTQLDDEFVATIKSKVANGGSAVIVLYEDGSHTQQAGRALAMLGGTVHSTTVPADELERMQQMIDEENN
jgi:uncharacterized membrane protein